MTAPVEPPTPPPMVWPATSSLASSPIATASMSLPMAAYASPSCLSRRARRRRPCHCWEPAPPTAGVVACVVGSGPPHGAMALACRSHAPAAPVRGATDGLVPLPRRNAVTTGCQTAVAVDPSWAALGLPAGACPTSAGSIGRDLPEILAPPATSPGVHAGEQAGQSSPKSS
jgi:hypothetical protein